MSFRDELEHCSARWVEAGLISPDQRSQILSFEAVPSAVQSRLVSIFGLLGAIFLVLGVLLVVSQNWGDIPRLPKLITGLLAMTLAFSVGYWVSFGRPQMIRIGSCVLLIGTGTFFANLALISQQYNIAINPSPLMLPVVLTAVLFAYLLRSQAYILLAAVSSVFWLIFESQNAGSVLEARNGLALVLVAGSGIWLLIASEANRRMQWQLFIEPLRIVGAATLFSAIFMLGFYRHFDVEIGLTVFSVITLLVIPLFFIATSLLTTVFRWEVSMGWPSITETVRRPVVATALTLALMLIWLLIVAVFPEGITDGDGISSAITDIYTVGFWILALALTADLIWLALMLRRQWWINMAFVYLGFFVLTRYFDLFSGNLQTAVVFAGAGLLLLTLALLLERGRRALRDEMVRDSVA